MLFDFERTLGIYTYNGRYLTGVKIRNLFWSFLDSIQEDRKFLELKLLIHINQETFLKLWPQAKDYFSEIIAIDKREMIYDIPGCSPHYFISEQEFAADLIVTSKAKIMKDYAEKLQENPEIYFEICSFFPEMLLRSNRTQRQLLSLDEIEQFNLEYLAQEQSDYVDLYLAVKTKLENLNDPQI